MPNVQNLDFLNENSFRNYPIKEGRSKIDTTGAFTIPDDFLVDFILSASADVTKSFYISQIVNHPTQITIVISDLSQVECGRFYIPVASHTQYTTYILVASTSYMQANGRITINSVGSMQNLPYGTFYFVSVNTEFEMRTIIPTINTISNIHFINNDNTNFSVTGAVTILARSNVKFTLIGGIVYLDAGEGLGLNAICNPDLSPILSINRNVKPDKDGNIDIVSGDKCVTFTPGTTSNSLLISNTCCQPCIGCDGISELTQRAMQVESDMLKLKEHFLQISTITSQFGTLLGYSCSC